MTNLLKKTALAGAMALTVAAGVAAVPSTADARFGGGGFHGGGFHGGFGGFRGGWGGRGWAGRGWGGRGFGYGYGRGWGGRGWGWRGGWRRGWAGGVPYWGGYGCGPYRRFYGACRYYYGLY